MKSWDKDVPVPDVSTALQLCIIAVMAAACFQSSLYGGFVFDDMEAVVNNDDVKLSTPLTQLFENDFWGTLITHNASHKSYRPLTVVSFRLNALVREGNLQARDFHMVNLVLYIVLCCASLFVLRSLLDGVRCQRVSFIASILFTCHPIHSEAVAPVVGRADILCAVFMFSSFLIYCQAAKNEKNYTRSVFYTLLAIMLAAVSMFTKEQGITVLAICCAYDLLISQKIHPRKLLSRNFWTCPSIRGFLTRQIMMGLAGILLLMLRWRIMGGTVPVFQTVDNPASFIDSAFLRVTNYMYIYVLNVWLLLCPEWLCFDWSMGCIPLIHSLYDPRIVCVVIFSSILTLLVVLLLKNANGESRRVAMALAFTVFPFLPASNLFFRVGFVIAERTLLVPSLGFCLMVALGIRQLSIIKLQALVCPCLVLLLLMFSARSHFRTTQWNTERVLFLSALSVCPLNAKVHYNLAKTSLNDTEAMAHYRNALRLNPEYDQAMNNLANILKDHGSLSEAETLLQKALKLRPHFAAAWMNLGIVLSHKKQFTDAEQSYRNAIKFRRKYPDCYYNLGNLFLEQKIHDKAYDSWRQATRLDPLHNAAWNNLIIMLDSLGRHSEAYSVGLEALKVLPSSASIHFNVANSQGKTSNFADAEEHFKTAIKINPMYPLYYVNLGVLYHHWKKLDKAKEMYQQALTLDPNLKSAKDNLRLLQKYV